MKRILLVFIFILTISSAAIPLRPASANESKTQPTSSVLCLPGIYMQDPGDCTPAGPSAYLTQMANFGITFPMTDLPATQPDPALTYVDVNYGLVRTRNAPVYGSLEDALKGNKKNAVNRINSPFSYISYKEDTVVDGKRFYQIAPGNWMTANDISRIGHPPLFQGLTFTRTPEHAFGWVLTYLSADPVQTKRTPGYEVDDYSGHILNNHDIVQVYSAKHVGDIDWYMIGPDEWLPQNVVARVDPEHHPTKRGHRRSLDRG